MSDLVTVDGVMEGGRMALVRKLCRVDSDDRQDLRVLGFQRLQLREDVQAVDSAVGPEIQQDHAASKFGEAKRG